MRSFGQAPLLAADRVFEVLNDGDGKNDPVVLDREAEDYAKGHMKGLVEHSCCRCFQDGESCQVAD